MWFNKFYLIRNGAKYILISGFNCLFFYILDFRLEDRKFSISFEDVNTGHKSFSTGTNLDRSDTVLSVSKDIFIEQRSQNVELSEA